MDETDLSFINDLNEAEYRRVVQHYTNDTCYNIRDVFPDIVDNQLVLAFLLTGYSLVFVMGVTGNLLSAYSFMCLNVNVGINSYFAMSLTSSDLLILLLSLPFTSIQIYTREWVFGPLFCKGVSVFQGVGIFVSSFTLAAIAIDRYLLVSHCLHASRLYY